MNKVVQFLKNNPVQFLSTMGLDGKPKVRPFQFILEENEKLYFCTSNKKKVYAEIKKNPFIELTVSNSEFEWIRLNGKAIFDNSLDLKNKIIESNSLVKSIYKSGDNPDFEIFYITEGIAEINDFSSNLPYKVKL